MPDSLCPLPLCGTDPPNLLCVCLQAHGRDESPATVTRTRIVKKKAPLQPISKTAYLSKPVGPKSRPMPAPVIIQASIWEHRTAMRNPGWVWGFFLFR